MISKHYTYLYILLKFVETYQQCDGKTFFFPIFFVDPQLPQSLLVGMHRLKALDGSFHCVTAGVGICSLFFRDNWKFKTKKNCFTFEFSPLCFLLIGCNWKFDIPILQSFPATPVGSPDFKAAFEVGFSILLGARAGWLSSRDEWQMWGKSVWTVEIVRVTCQF